METSSEPLREWRRRPYIYQKGVVLQMRKFMAVLAVVALVAFAAPAFAANPFADVPMNHWALTRSDSSRFRYRQRRIPTAPSRATSP